MVNLILWPYRLAKKDIVAQLRIQGEPLPKARPRFDSRRKRVYNPTTNQAYQDALGWQLKVALGGIPDRDSLFGLRVIFQRKDRHRIDVDNLVKTVLDGATGVVWGDDRQVREIIARLITDNEQPGTDLLFYHIKDSVGARLCPFCKKEFYRPPSVKTKYCSPACRYAAVRITVECEWCHKFFVVSKAKVSRTKRKYCSKECSVKAWAEHRRTLLGDKASIHWRCKDCGGRVTRKEYTRCKACAMKARKTFGNYWLHRPALI